MADYTLRSKMSDIQWTVASKKFEAPAEATHTAVWIPYRAFVRAVYLVMPTTAFSAADATVTVGFTGNGETADPDAFLLSADVDPDAVGSVCSIAGTGVCAGGKYFSQKGCITVTTDNGTAGTAGTFQIFVDYAQITD